MVESVLAPEMRNSENRAPCENSPAFNSELRTDENRAPGEGGAGSGQKEALDIDLDSDIDFDTGPSAGPSAGPFTKRVRRAETPSPSSAVDSSSTFQASVEELIHLGHPMFFSQADFNNLVRDMGIPNHIRELLGSRLTHRILVLDDFRITAARNPELTKEFDELFVTDVGTKIT